MKKSWYGVTLFLLVLIGSCKQSNEESPQSSDIFQATIGTKAFSTGSVSKSYLSSGNPARFSFTANITGGAEFIVLIINNFDRNNPKGSYTIGTATGSAANAVYHNHNTGVEDAASSGQLTISEFAANKITGNFNFTTQGGLQITNGTFSITLP